MRALLLILPVMVSISACTEERNPSVREAPRTQYLQFEYQVAAAGSVDWKRLNQQLIDGDITIDEADLGTGQWCKYDVQAQPTPGQVDADLVPLEQTRAPYLSAFGNPRSMQFNFLITAFQARNTAPRCGRLDTTLQGLDLAGGAGAASGAWRTGVSVVSVARPELGDAWLGPALEYVSRADGEPMYFEHAVQSVSDAGYVQGDFRFMQVSADGRYVLLARNGRFGMNSTQ